MSERVQQVNQLLRQEVGNYLQENLSNHTGVLTITAVETSADLRLATVWYGYVGEDLSEVIRELRRCKRDLQAFINKRLGMKNVPRVSFKHDTSGEYVIEISKLIDEANSDSKQSN